MAHTPKAADERRRDPHLYPIGSWVGTYVAHPTTGKSVLVKAKVSSYDEGGWMYVSGWKNMPPGTQLSTYLRSTNCFPLGEEAPPDLAIMKASVQKHHDDKGKLPMRWGTFSGIDIQMRHGGCFAGFSGALSKSYSHSAVIFHGDGAALGWDAIKDNTAFAEAMKNYTRPANAFEGTERSKLWVHYLMGPKSPWRALHPYIVEKDVDFINNAGFIFDNKKDKGLPTKLTYNFALAIRYPWELPRNYSLWLMLLEKGIEPTLALFLTNFIAPKPEAKDIDGPYEVVYPWSFLESARLDCARRFILGEPKTLATSEGSQYGDEDGNNNVFSLWRQKNKTCDSLFKDMCSEKDMSLEQAIKYVEQAVAAEQEVKETVKTPLKGKVAKAAPYYQSVNLAPWSTNNG